MTVAEFCGSNDEKILGGTFIEEPMSGETLSLAVGLSIWLPVLVNV